MNEKDKEKIIQAGKIAKQVRIFCKTIVKLDVPLLEIAEKIEAKIIELGGKPAFPVNLSINDVAAHYTPSYDDEKKARGLLKVDFGVHIEGFVADTALSFDLEKENSEESKENKKLIEASEEALKKAIEKIKLNVELGEIGKTIQEAIEKKGFFPIVNLSGHSIEQYDLHSGATVPNYDNKSKDKVKTGVYAIEPFSVPASASGKVRDGKPSGIYMVVADKPIRNPSAREVLNFIAEEYQTLPFCSRWIHKQFGIKTNIALSQLEKEGIIHQFEQLIESSNSKVSQAEHTILVEKDKIIVTTD